MREAEDMTADRPMISGLRRRGKLHLAARQPSRHPYGFSSPAPRLRYDEDIGRRADNAGGGVDTWRRCISRCSRGSAYAVSQGCAACCSSHIAASVATRTNTIGSWPSPTNGEGPSNDQERIRTVSHSGSSLLFSQGFGRGPEGSGESVLDRRANRIGRL